MDDKNIIVGEIFYECTFRPVIDHIEKILSDNGITITHKLDNVNSVLMMTHDQLSVATDKYYDSNKESLGDI